MNIKNKYCGTFWNLNTSKVKRYFEETYAEVKTDKNGMLTRSLMVGIRAEINQTLLSSPYSRNIIIISNRKFTIPNMFSAKCKLFY